jgi:hypothetical protein
MTWLLTETQRKFEMLHFGYVAQWEGFRGAEIFKQLFAHDDTSLTRQFFYFTRFTAADSCHVWMLIRGYINQLCGETPAKLFIGVLAPTTKFFGLEVTQTETQRKTAVNAPYQIG